MSCKLLFQIKLPGFPVDTLRYWEKPKFPTIISPVATVTAVVLFILCAIEMANQGIVSPVHPCK